MSLELSLRLWAGCGTAFATEMIFWVSPWILMLWADCVLGSFSWSALSLGPLSTVAGCVGGSKHLADEKAGLGAGWNRVKKANSREHTPLDVQKSLRNWRWPGFSPPGTVPESGTQAVRLCGYLLTSSVVLSTGAGSLAGFQGPCRKKGRLEGKVRW